MSHWPQILQDNDFEVEDAHIITYTLSEWHRHIMHFHCASKQKISNTFVYLKIFIKLILINNKFQVKNRIYNAGKMQISNTALCRLPDTNIESKILFRFLSI